MDDKDGKLLAKHIKEHYAPFEETLESEFEGSINKMVDHYWLTVHRQEIIQGLGAIMQEQFIPNITGHVMIRDKETGKVLVDKNNAIHYGNMAFIVAQALTDTSDAFVHYMAFGNGATSVDTAGKVSYKSPRVTDAYDQGANLYSRTYWKAISTDTENTDQTSNFIQVINGTSYTDLKMTCTLSFNEPGDQDVFDSSTTNDGDYIFDEIALFSYPTNPALPTAEERINTSTMLTHVIFHPVQKSANRIIEIVYTIRIQLS